MDISDLFGLLIQIIVSIIVLAPVLWLVGRALAGKDKAKFTDAIWIVVLGTVIDALIRWFASGLGWIGLIVIVIVWLALIKHFFDCGWLKALAIAIIAVVVYIIVLLVLAAILVIIGISGIPIGWP